MTADELRAKWGSASPEERDAMVAEAQGFVVRYPYDAADPWIEKPPTRMMKQCPQWSTSWADAGQLLDELIRQNEKHRATLGFAHDEWHLVIGDGEWLSATAAPEAIALAYCLAKLEDR